MLRVRAAGVALALLALADGSGCVVLRHSISSMTTPLAADLVQSLQEQSDLQLVHDGGAAFLLVFDGLVRSSPDNDGLLLAAANAQIAYAGAFVGREEAPRARAMFAKARDYGLRVLRRRGAFDKVWDRPLDAFASAMPAFGSDDVPALYATATAWAGWIISSPDSMQALSEFSKVRALMQRVLDLAPGCQHGGPEQFFGIYYAIQPRGGGQDLAKSKEFFERAMKFAGPDYLLVRVTYAEFYARYAFDRELFEKTLKDVLAHGGDRPEFRLTNAAARRRAQGLLERADDIF